MAQTIIKGDDLMLFYKDGNIRKSIGYATNHVLTITGETQDTSTKDHGIYGAVEVSKVTWEATTENLYTTTDYDKLFDLMIAKTKVEVVFGIKAESNPNNVVDGTVAAGYYTAGTSYKKGDAYITSLVANAATGENATFTATFSGTGSISKVNG